MKSNAKYTLSTIVLLFNVLVNAQNIAIAFPAENIKIDGSFKDWPTDLPKYRIEHHYGPSKTSQEDISAWFMSAFNVAEKALYIGVEVFDDEYIGDNGESHTTQDHALLYLDILHSSSGGAPIYFVAAENHRELLKKDAFWDSHHAGLTLEDAQVEIMREKNTTRYEWKVFIGNAIKSGAAIGIDHFIIDQDPNQPEQANLVWKDTFGKSQGSQRMGTLLLLKRDTKLGKVEGVIDFEKLSKTERVDEIGIESLDKPTSWASTSVDSTGYFQAFLPSGRYRLQPNRAFSSFIYSTGFKQNTRKIEYTGLDEFMIPPSKTVKLDTIKLKMIPRPELGREKGILWSDEKDIPKKIDAFARQWKAYLDIPGISIVAIKKGKVIYDTYMGIKSNATKESVDNNTLFEAASISKSVFAVMLLKYYEKGLIDLDKPLYEYLGFPNLENDDRYKKITARIVLNHQSGLPNWAFGGPGAWQNGAPGQLNFEPGTEFGYSGEAFNYLGRVLESISGKKLPQIFDEEIARPLKLKNTFYAFSDDQQSHTAVGHYHQYPNYKGKEYMPSPASSVTTNAHDFKKFVLALMNEKLLTASTFELLYAPFTVLKPDQRIYDPNIPQYISHGFFVQDTQHGKLLAHGGNNGDYDCKFAYNPEQKIGYAIFTNSNLGDEFTRQLELFLVKP